MLLECGQGSRTTPDDLEALIRVARAAASFANRIEAMPVEDYKNVVVECIAIERTLLPLLEEV